MSLISLVITNNFITMASDGRVITSQTNEIIEEGYKKVFKYNDIVIGSSGIAEFGERIKNNLSQISRIFSFQELMKILQVEFIEMEKAYGHTGLITTILMAGFINGEPNAFIISNESGKPEVESYRITKNETDILVFAGYPRDFTPTINYLDIIQKELLLEQERGTLTTEKILSRQKEFNNFVSNKAFSVNDIFFYEVINKVTT